MPWRGCFSPLVRHCCPAGVSRRPKTAAAEKAHVRGAVPMVVPEVPERCPADALAHLTRRPEEAQAEIGRAHV